MDILQHLVLEGLYSRHVKSLTDEAALRGDFVEGFPFNCAEAYGKCKHISRDTSMDDRAKQRAIDALRRTFESLLQAVRNGQLTEEQLSDPLLPIVLYHVFPPAATVSRRTYLSIVSRFNDHPQHVERWKGRAGETVFERMERLLRGFNFAEHVEALLRAEKSKIPSILSRLEPVQIDIELGEEHERVLSDLVGQELAGMERELFGDSSTKGKLEYERRESGAYVTLRL